LRQGALTIRQPTYLAELALAPVGASVASDGGMPNRAGVEQALVEKALNPFLEEIATQRTREVETIAQHLEISLGELIHRANMSLAELANRRIEGESIPGLEGNIAQAEAHLDELNNRLEGRRVELAMERHLAMGDIEHLGCAWVLPHPQRTSPSIAPMVRDEEIERIAVKETIRHEGGVSPNDKPGICAGATVDRVAMSSSGAEVDGDSLKDIFPSTDGKLCGRRVARLYRAGHLFACHRGRR
jgi:hypothetical protein